MNDTLRTLLGELMGWYLEMVRALPRLALALVFFIGAYFLADLIKRKVSRRFDRGSRDPIVGRFLAQVVKSLMLIVSIGLVLRIMGLTGIAGSLLAGAGIGAFILGFAFKDLGENFLAGMMLAFRRPFDTGDLVEINGFKGHVQAIALRQTHMKTSDGSDVFIPNSNVVKNPLINYTMDGYLRHELRFRLPLTADLDKAAEVIKGSMAGLSGVLQAERSPKVVIGELAWDHVDLTLNYWVDVLDKGPSEDEVKWEAVKRTVDQLRTAGFTAPLNVLEVRQGGTMPKGSLKADHAT